ncbi:hypothetical protein ACTG9Q_25930 [Actinokineospora sp. 24-640]
MTNSRPERADKAPAIAPVVFSHPAAESQGGQPVPNRSGTPVSPLVFR